MPKPEEIEEVKEPENEVEHEYSAEETEALDSGWNPEGKDKDGNTLDAKEYMARKPLFNKIHNLRDEQSSMKSQLDTLRGDMRKMTQSFMAEKTALVDQLKEQRIEALDNLETDKVKQLDKEIERVGATQQPAAAATQSDWRDAYITFLKGNAWYDQQPGLKSAADLIGQEYTAKNPTSMPSDVYAYIENEIKKEFADRFENKTSEQKTSSKVSTSNRRSTSSTQKQGTKLSDLDAESQKVVQVMAQATGKTIEEYLKNYEP